MILGEKIKYLRIKAGLTQQEFGRMVGMTQPGVQKIESEESNPRYDTLEKIADALGIQIDDLISYTHTQKKTLENEDVLLDHFQKLNEAGQEQAISLVKLVERIEDYKK